MRRHKTPEQLKAWRQRDWKPLGYKRLVGHYCGEPIYEDDPRLPEIRHSTYGLKAWRYRGHNGLCGTALGV